jgi:hypothetical protein
MFNDDQPTSCSSHFEIKITSQGSDKFNKCKKIYQIILKCRDAVVVPHLQKTKNKEGLLYKERFG